MENSMPVKYVCICCQYTTPALNVIQMHYEECCTKRALCLICNKILDSFNILKRHIETEHTPAFHYSCSECPFATINIPTHQRHLMEHGQNDFYFCPSCSMYFHRKFDYNSHMESHKYRLFSVATSSAIKTPIMSPRIAPSEITTGDIPARSSRLDDENELKGGAIEDLIRRESKTWDGRSDKTKEI